MEHHHTQPKLSVLAKIFYFAVGFLASFIVSLIGTKIALGSGIFVTEPLIVVGSILLIISKKIKPEIRFAAWGALTRSIILILFFVGITALLTNLFHHQPV